MGETTFEEQVHAEARRAAEELEQESEQPTLLMCGKTGAGKSSLCNALAGAHVQEVGVVPTTQTPEVVDVKDEIALRVYDVAGFGEADQHDERVSTMLGLLDRVHLVLMVVGHPDRALDMEVDFLDRLRKHFGGAEYAMPLLVAANKIDMAKPARDWDPSTLQLEPPSSKKAENISKWVKYVDAALSRRYDALVRPCSASEFWNDRANQYGIEELRMDVFEALPEAAKTYYARLVKDARIRERRANGVIYAASASAAAAAMQPLPGVPDAALLAPIQVAMITSVATVYEANPNDIDAVKLLAPALSTVSGRLAFQQVIKFIPALGSVASAAIAGAITLSLGQAYHYLIKNDVLAPSKDEFRNAFQRFYRKNDGKDVLKVLKNKLGDKFVL